MKRTPGCIETPAGLGVPASNLFGASGGSAELPESFSLAEWVTIRDQGQLGSCVWFAIDQALRVFLAYRGYKGPMEFSPLFGYHNTLRKENTLGFDIGCRPINAFEVLMDLGVPEERTWPYEESKVFEKPSWAAFQDAIDLKTSTSFYRITEYGDDRALAIKTAISKGYPVVWGTPLSKHYEEQAKAGVVPVPVVEECVGRHARCIVGYTPDYFLEANSWGTSFGDKGFAKISYDYINWLFSSDFWVVDGVVP